MNTNTDIQISTPSDLNIKPEAVAEFYDANWNRKIALANENFYKWQFIDTPDNLTDNCCIAVIGEEIIAVMGLNERPFQFNGKALHGAELTTWIVSPNHQGLGLGPKMLDYLQSKYSVLFGMGITTQALHVYLTKGFKYLKSIPRFVKVLNNAVVEEHGVSTRLSNKLVELTSPSVNYKEITPTSDQLDNITQTFSANTKMFKRSSDWLAWRYDNHPSFDYKKTIIENDEGQQCVVVYRIDHLDKLTMMHCLDLYGDQNAFSSAICYLEDEAKKHNADVLDFYTTHSLLGAYFKSRNWFSVLDCDYFDFPHLFHPIEMRKPSTTSLIMWHKEQDPTFYDTGSLYLTKQDCDFDRPTASNV